MSLDKEYHEEKIPVLQRDIVYPVYEELYPVFSSKVEERNSEFGELREELTHSDEEEKYFRGVVDPLRATLCEFQDTSPIGSYWLTKLVIVLNILVALFTGGIFFITDEFAYKTYPSAVCIATGGCFLGIIFSMFSHANFLHLLGNMFFLYIVGDNIEITLGRLRYLIVYFVSGIVGAYTQALIMLAFDLGGAHIPMVGASAAISGLIGGYVLLYPGSAMCKCVGYRYVYKCFKVRASIYLVFWVLLQFLYVLISPFIAVWAHLGGFFTGLVLTYFLADRRRIKELREGIAKGRYRGISPQIEDVAEGSLGSVARGVIVFAATVLLLLVVTSAIIVLTSLEGYYIVYLKYVKTCLWSWVMMSEICGQDFVGADYNFTKVLPSSLEDIVSELPSLGDSRRILIYKPFAIYNLYNVSLTAVLLSATTVALFISVLYIMAGRYRDVEVV
jgi:membrane associated rhomboid family serine protease